MCQTYTTYYNFVIPDCNCYLLKNLLKFKDAVMYV